MKKIIIALCMGAIVLMAGPGPHCQKMNEKICPEKIAVQCPHCAKLSAKVCPEKAEMKCTGKSDCQCPHCAQTKKSDKSGPNCKNCDK